MYRRLVQVAIAALCLALSAVPAAAQVFTGRIDVTVVDSTGAVLPGVVVTLSGTQSASVVTDERGEARFLNLAPGKYAVVANLSGFADWKNENVPVNAGAIVPLKVTMAIGGVSSAVEVRSFTPAFDPKKKSQSTNVTNDELQQVPSSRDPWVVLQTVPGVIVDRVNVGGAESGQQSNYQAKGAPTGDNTWNIDGIPITDMSALGSSPTYYDFDMFQEMQISTGGADVTNVTPGVSLNFILKSGSNTARGSTRFYFENESMQANNLPAELKAALGGVTGKGNRMDEYKDYGAELGGPIWRDKIWAWGAYGKTDVTVLTLANTPDRTRLQNYSFKGTGQVTQDLRAAFTYYRGEKIKNGRSAGPTRPPETTWDQGGPTQMYKGEGNLMVGNNLFVTGRYAYVDGGFFLTPQGGMDVNMIFADDSGIGRNSWYRYETIRPQRTATIDANLFRGKHELKMGFGYRKADVDSSYIVPGNGVMTYHAGYPNMIAEVTAWDHFTGVTGKYLSGFLSDTISLNRMTVDLGFRWDRQSSSVNAYAQKGNPIFPTLLPDLTGQAAKDVIVWNSISPRAGVSYAITSDRKTIGRLSYAQFASQMNAGEGGFFSTVGSFRGVYVYDVVDKNGNGTVDAAELAGRTADNWYGFDISNPANISTPNHKVGDYKTPKTHEVILGIDRELMENFGISASYTYRKFVDFVWRPVQGLRSDDYVQRGTFTGSIAPVGSFSVPFYGVTSVPANRTATEYVARDGYSQKYNGFEMAATKRMSNRWMARFGFSMNDHKEYFDGPNSRVDPTPTVANPNIDGGQVMRSTTGSGKSGIYMVLPKYQFIVTGLYQAPWGINAGMNMLVRQGYAMPYNHTRVATGDPLGNLKTVLLVSDVTDHRLPSVTSLDVRLGKEFTFGRTRANLDLDLFNALNKGTVLGRQYDLRVPTANTVLEIMNPRILRLGVRFSF